jgi:hypothetical protein
MSYMPWNGRPLEEEEEEYFVWVHHFDFYYFPEMQQGSEVHSYYNHIFHWACFHFAAQSKILNFGTKNYRFNKY